IIDRSNPATDKVTAIADFALKPGSIIQHPSLPFTVRTLDYLRFSQLVRRQATLPGFGTAAATAGQGLQLSAVPVGRPKKEDETASGARWVERRGPAGAIAPWLVSTEPDEPQSFTVDGRPYTIALRPRRFLADFSLKLLDFRFDRYPGTQLAHNYS